MSVTPCDLSSSRISSLGQSIRARQRMMPLQVFREEWQDSQPDCLSCWVNGFEKPNQPPAADPHCEGIWLIWQFLLHILKPCRQRTVRFLTVVCHHPLLGWQTTCRSNFHSCPVPCYGRTLSERPCYILPMFFLIFYGRLSWPNGWTDLHETFTRGRY